MRQSSLRQSIKHPLSVRKKHCNHISSRIIEGPHRRFVWHSLCSWLGSRLPPLFCTLHFSFFFLHFTLCNVHFPHSTMHYSLCAMHNAICTMRFAPTFLLSTIAFLLCITDYTLCALHFSIYTMHYALCTIQYSLCTMHYILCTLQYALVTFPYALCALRLHYTIPEPTHVGTSFMFSASLVFLAILVLLTSCRAPHCVGYFSFCFLTGRWHVNCIPGSNINLMWELDLICPSETWIRNGRPNFLQFRLYWYQPDEKSINARLNNECKTGTLIPSSVIIYQKAI